MSTAAINAGKAVVTVGLDTKGIDRDVADMRIKLKSLGTAFSEVGFEVVKLGGAITFGLVKALQLLDKPLKISSQIEKATISFEVLTGSANMALKTVQELRMFARNSPLTFAGVTQATETLLAYGIAAKDVVKDVKRLGAVSRGDQTRLERLALAYGQVAAKGKLYASEVRQFTESGFNPLQEMSRNTGRSIGQLMKDMEDGMITFDMVRKSIESTTEKGGRFFGLLEKQAKSLSGVYNQMADAILMSVQPIGDALAPVLKEIMHNVMQTSLAFGEFLTRNKDLIPPVVAAVAALTAMSGALTAVGLAMLGVGSMSKIFLTLANAAGLLSKTIIVSTAEQMSTAGVAAAEMAASITQSVSVASTALGGLSARISSTAKRFSDAAFRMAESFADASVILQAEMAKIGAVVTTGGSEVVAIMSGMYAGMAEATAKGMATVDAAFVTGWEALLATTGTMSTAVQAVFAKSLSGMAKSGNAARLRMGAAVKSLSTSMVKMTTTTNAAVGGMISQLESYSARLNKVVAEITVASAVVGAGGKKRGAAKAAEAFVGPMPGPAEAIAAVTPPPAVKAKQAAVQRNNSAARRKAARKEARDIAIEQARIKAAEELKLKRSRSSHMRPTGRGEIRRALMSDLGTVGATEFGVRRGYRGAPNMLEREATRNSHAASTKARKARHQNIVGQGGFIPESQFSPDAFEGPYPNVGPHSRHEPFIGPHQPPPGLGPAHQAVVTPFIPGMPGKPGSLRRNLRGPKRRSTSPGNREAIDRVLARAGVVPGHVTPGSSTTFTGLEEMFGSQKNRLPDMGAEDEVRHLLEKSGVRAHTKKDAFVGPMPDHYVFKRNFVGPMPDSSFVGPPRPRRTARAAIGSAVKSASMQAGAASMVAAKAGMKGMTTVAALATPALVSLMDPLKKIGMYLSTTIAPMAMFGAKLAVIAAIVAGVAVAFYALAKKTGVWDEAMIIASKSIKTVYNLMKDFLGSFVDAVKIGEFGLAFELSMATAKYAAIEFFRFMVATAPTVFAMLGKMLWGLGESIVTLFTMLPGLIIQSMYGGLSGLKDVIAGIFKGNLDQGVLDSWSKNAKSEMKSIQDNIASRQGNSVKASGAVDSHEQAVQEAIQKKREADKAKIEAENNKPENIKRKLQNNVVIAERIHERFNNKESARKLDTAQRNLASGLEKLNIEREERIVAERQVAIDAQAKVIADEKKAIEDRNAAQIDAIKRKESLTAAGVDPRAMSLSDEEIQKSQEKATERLDSLKEDARVLLMGATAAEAHKNAISGVTKATSDAIRAQSLVNDAIKEKQGFTERISKTKAEAFATLSGRRASSGDGDALKASRDLVAERQRQYDEAYKVAKQIARPGMMDFMVEPQRLLLEQAKAAEREAKGLAAELDKVEIFKLFVEKVKDLGKEIRELAMGKEAAATENLRREGLNEEQIRNIQLLQQQRDGLQKLNDAQEQRVKDAQDIKEQFKSPEAKFKEQQKKIIGLQVRGMITQEEAARAFAANLTEYASTMREDVIGSGARALTTGSQEAAQARLEGIKEAKKLANNVIAQKLAKAVAAGGKGANEIAKQQIAEAKTEKDEEKIIRRDSLTALQKIEKAVSKPEKVIKIL